MLRSRSTARALALLLLWTGSTAGIAAAQEPSPDDVEMARDLFVSGIEAAEETRWSAARIDFERSYELAPRPSTLFNLANAQMELGDLVGAATSYRLFLQEVDSGRAAAYRPDAEAALAEIEPRIAQVTVDLTGATEGDALAVDGGPAPVGVPIPMNPGAHHLTVRRGDEVVGDVHLDLVEGEERGLSIPVRAPAPALAVSPDPPGTDRDEDIAASPWLWLGVAAGVLAIAGVAIAIGFAASGTEPLYVGNFGTGQVTFE